MSEVNVHLFVIASVDTFSENKKCYKAIRSYNFVSTFPKKGSTESCQNVELNLCKFVMLVTSWDFVPGLSEECFHYFFRVVLIENTVDGRDLVRASLGVGEARRGIWSKDGGIKPSGHHGCVD